MTLQMARVSDAITDFLLPGITSQTSRACYYSFYLVEAQSPF